MSMKVQLSVQRLAAVLGPMCRQDLLLLPLQLGPTHLWDCLQGRWCADHLALALVVGRCWSWLRPRRRVGEPRMAGIKEMDRRWP